MNGGFDQYYSSFVFLITKLAKNSMSISSAATRLSLPLVLGIAGLPLIPFQRVIFLSHLDIVWSDNLLTSLPQEIHQNVTRDRFS